MKSKIQPSKMTRQSPTIAAPKRAARKTKPGVEPAAPNPAKVTEAEQPDWSSIARDWADEYRRTSGNEAKILGYTDGRIRVFTTRDATYALGELRGMALVLKRRQSAPAGAR